MPKTKDSRKALPSLLNLMQQNLKFQVKKKELERFKLKYKYCHIL